MILYLYKIGTSTPVLTIENARSYTAERVTAADGADRSEDRCIVYIKEGTSLIDGIVYGGISRGEPLCAPGDRLLPLPAQYTASLPANGAYRIESVEMRTQGTCGVRHTKLTAR